MNTIKSYTSDYQLVCREIILNVPGQTFKGH